MTSELHSYIIPTTKVTLVDGQDTDVIETAPVRDFLTVCDSNDNMIIGVDLAKGPDRTCYPTYDQKRSDSKQKYEMFSRSKNMPRRVRRYLRRASQLVKTEHRIGMVYALVKKERVKRRRNMH